MILMRPSTSSQKEPLFGKDHKKSASSVKEEKEWLEYEITIIMIKFSQALSFKF